ncbi:MAG: hypothetical protein HQL11_03095 [Candidatus Omnitrophica bacterium]|nr:hypothetical protein [Candidatus Omnitrophota bacterium]
MSTASLAGMFVSHGWMGTDETASYWVLVLSPVLAWGAAWLWRAFGSAGPQRFAVFRVPAAVLAGIVYLVWVVMSPAFASHLTRGHLPVRKSVLFWLLDKVPGDASVMTTPLFLPALANRMDLRLFGSDRESQPASNQPEYALMDFGPYLLAPSEAGTVNSDHLQSLARFFSKPWNAIESVGSVVLFGAGPQPPGQGLYEVVKDASDRPYLDLEASAGDDLHLVGFTMESDDQNIDIVRFVFYWKKLRQSQVQYGTFFNIMSPGGEVVHTIKKPLCYQLYPFADWPVGEIVKERYAFVVPEDLVHSMYEVHLGVYDVASGELMNLNSQRKDAIDAWGLARLIALDAI